MCFALNLISSIPTCQNCVPQEGATIRAGELKPCRCLTSFGSYRVFFKVCNPGRKKLKNGQSKKKCHESRVANILVIYIREILRCVAFFFVAFDLFDLFADLCKGEGRGDDVGRGGRRRRKGRVLDCTTKLYHEKTWRAGRSARELSCSFPLSHHVWGTNIRIGGDNVGLIKSTKEPLHWRAKRDPKA